MEKILEKQDRSIWLRLITLIFGVQWFMAGFEKIIKPEFSNDLTKTLGYFASKNPHAWYANLIHDIFIPNAKIFANLVSFGELLIGLALILGLLTNIALIFAIFLNLNFYFATGWTSPSASGINLLMILVQIILILAYASKAMSIDELIVKRAPKLKRLLISKTN